MNKYEQSIVDRLRYAVHHNQSVTLGADEVHIPMNDMEELDRYRSLDIPLDRLEEICAAERDERVVVLPKRGDKLFYYPYLSEPTTLRNTGDGSGTVEAIRVQVRFDNWSRWVPISKTRAEAEAKGGA